MEVVLVYLKACHVEYGIDLFCVAVGSRTSVSEEAHFHSL